MSKVYRQVKSDYMVEIDSIIPAGIWIQDFTDREMIVISVGECKGRISKELFELLFVENNTPEVVVEDVEVSLSIKELKKSVKSKLEKKEG